MAKRCNKRLALWQIAFGEHRLSKYFLCLTVCMLLWIQELPYIVINLFRNKRGRKINLQIILLNESLYLL